MPLSSRGGIGSSSSTETLVLNQGAVPQFVSPKTERPGKKPKALKDTPIIGSIAANKSRTNH